MSYTAKGNKKIINKGTAVLVAASKKNGLDIIAKKTKYVFMSRDEHAGKNHKIKISNKSFERVEQFKYLETALTNQYLIHEEIKIKLKSGNACCHSVQNLLSSTLLSKNINIKIYRTIILRVVLYGCETWSLTLREDRRLNVSEKRVLRIFGGKRDEVTREWRKLHNEEFNDLYSSTNIIRVISSRKMVSVGHGTCMGNGDVHTGF
jgi:hypothetical protein